MEVEARIDVIAIGGAGDEAGLHSRGRHPDGASEVRGELPALRGGVRRNGPVADFSSARYSQFRHALKAK